MEARKVRTGCGSMSWRLTGLLLFSISGILTVNYARAASVTVCDAGCNYSSISSALTAVGPGNHTVTVQGAYTRNERVTVSNSGSAVGAELIIRSSNTNTVQGFTVNGNYIIIDGFNITNTGGNHGIWCQSCRYGIFRNNKIHGMPDTVVAIKFGNSMADNPTFNTIENNEIYNNAYPSVMCYGNNQTFVNNKFHDLKHDAIDMWGANHVVRSNTFYRVEEQYNGAHVDIIQTWGYAGQTSNNVLFERNLVYDSVAQFANLQDYNYALANWTFRNNVYINMGFNGTIGIDGVKIYNNIFWNTDIQMAGWAITPEIDSVKSSCAGFQIKNNLFGGINNSSRGWYSPTFTSCGGGASADYNYVVGPGPTFGSKTGFSEPHGVNGGNPFFNVYSKPFVHTDDNSGSYKGDSTHIEVNGSVIGKFVVGEYIEIDRDGVARRITGKSGNVVAFTPTISPYLAPYCTVANLIDTANYTDSSMCSTRVFLLGSQSTAMPSVTQESIINLASPAIGTGINISTFTDDYNGITRPTVSAWDIGAYQVGSVAVGTSPPPPLRNPLYPGSISIN